MSVELKPCPFCGGSAWTEEYPVKDGLSTFSAYCERCGAETSLSYKSREEAVEAWNTRAERSCSDVGTYCFTCSECGFVSYEQRHIFGGFRPNYCPICGAKVVEG